MTNMRKYAGSAYVRVEDVRTHPIQATIIKVSEGNYGRPELLLSTGQRFSVNATNVKTLISAYGEDDADWIGMLIELVSGFTKFKGEDQESVLVKAISPGKPLAKRTVRNRSGPTLRWTTKFRSET
jgi:hypothetical protein